MIIQQLLSPHNQYGMMAVLMERPFKLKSVIIIINRPTIKVPICYTYRSDKPVRRKKKWWTDNDEDTIIAFKRRAPSANERVPGREQTCSESARRVPADLWYPRGDDLSLLHLQPTQPPDTTLHPFLSAPTLWWNLLLETQTADGRQECHTLSSSTHSGMKSILRVKQNW